ncbi:MAG: TRIC cation channel family protein [Desulfovibrio sp.]|jgi:uncharacterized membrane protein YeiH|nr:TRIC cation channel family protein [Desulfovibrio sp.]
MGGGPLFILDMAACALLAAAAACRGRTYGGHVTGAMVLACLSGLSLPLLRDGLLGEVAFSLDRSGYLAAAVSGGFVGIAAARFLRRWPACFYWLDSAGLALAAGISASKAGSARLGLTGCLVLGVLSALVGGLVRDMALGDAARAVGEPMYATAAVFGVLLTLALTAYGLGRPWQCALAGAALIVALRFLRDRRGGEAFHC